MCFIDKKLYLYFLIFFERDEYNRIDISNHIVWRVAW